MSTSTPGTRADFEDLDLRDELRSSRERFDLPASSW